jgi:polyisoprenyl-phosphate glycosyltransferase
MIDTQGAKAAYRDIVILTPVYNDWEALGCLLAEIDDQFRGKESRLRIIAVNDGSNEPSAPIRFQESGPIVSVEVLSLACNLGHQRAIALGLAYIAENRPCEAIVVMDADGEDRPSDIAVLMREGATTPGSIVVARRDKRSEGPLFKALYGVYRAIFRVLTGQHIKFGNFSLIPFEALDRLIYSPNLWNNLPATIMRSRHPYRLVSTYRGQRYSGESTMSLIPWIVHGLSIVAVYSDHVVARMLLASVVATVAAAIAFALIAFQPSVGDMAIPDGISYAAFVLIGVMMQLILAAVFLSFLLLHARSQRSFIPAKHYQDYVLGIERL